MADFFHGMALGNFVLMWVLILYIKDLRNRCRNLEGKRDEQEAK